MIKTLPISKARANFANLVNNTSKKMDEYIITVNGSPAAVLISPEEYDSLKETDEILADPELMEAIREGEEDFKKGNVVTLEQLKKDLKLDV